MKIKKLKIFAPVLFLLIGIFIFLEYESIEQISNSYNGNGKGINSLLIIMYSLLGRMGTLIFIISVGIFGIFKMYSKKSQNNKL